MGDVIWTCRHCGRRANKRGALCQRCREFDARYAPLKPPVTDLREKSAELRAESEAILAKVSSGELFRQVFGKDPA